MYNDVIITSSIPLQVESSLDYDAGPVRRNTIRILRNVLAKHDCDPRYADAVSGLYSSETVDTLHPSLLPSLLPPSLPLDLPSSLPLSLPPSLRPSLPPSLSPFLPPSLSLSLPLSLPPFLPPSKGQKARIAALYFPLIPLVMEHLIRLDTGSALYISPMLNTTSMATFNSQARPQVGKTFSSSKSTRCQRMKEEEGGREGGRARRREGWREGGRDGGRNTGI